MIISIHQPNFMPWLGYFYKIARSDIFVLLDDVQYTKNSYINRNRIKTPQGEMWITLPVMQSGSFGQNINHCVIQRKDEAVRKILNAVRLNYGRSPYFARYYTEFEDVMQSRTDYLSELNTELIRWACNRLGITTPLVTSSSLNVHKKNSTERLIEICKTLDCSTYLCGKGGTKYQDETLFAANGIAVNVSPFRRPVYSQLWGSFVPDLSVIDLLFNAGDNAGAIIMSTENLTVAV